jgi:hypothetical protein
VAIWYISPHFGILCQEKSGTPASEKGAEPNRSDGRQFRGPILDQTCGLASLATKKFLAILDQSCGWIARWFIFKPKIPIWEKFGGPWKGKCCYAL